MDKNTNSKRGLLILLSPEHREILKKAADRRGTSISGLLRMAGLEKALEIIPTDSIRFGLDSTGHIQKI